MHESSMKQKVKNTIWVEHPKAVDLEACISKALKLQASAWNQQQQLKTPGDQKLRKSLSSKTNSKYPNPNKAYSFMLTKLT